MNSHPTKEQVAAAKAWAEGGGTTTDFRILDKEKPAATNVFYWRDKQSLLILAAALASAERDAERLDWLEKRHATLTSDGWTEIVPHNYFCEYSFGDRNVRFVRRFVGYSAREAIDAAMAAQRKEGE